MAYRSVCIVGPGAVGGMMAVRLERAGFRVSALARPAKAAFIAEKGITLHDEGQTFHGKPRVATDPADLGPQDLVIVTLKGTGLHAVAPVLEKLCGPDTPIVFVMNGVPWWFFDGFGGALAGTRLTSLDPGGELDRLVPRRRVIWGVVNCSVTERSDGSLNHDHSANVTLGRPDDDPAGVVAVTEVFHAAGYTSIVSPKIRDHIWVKLMINLAMNPVSALAMVPTSRILTDPLLRDLVFAVSDEGRAVAAKLGLDPGPDLRERFKTPPPQNPHSKTSMLQDLERGRPLEIDSIVTAVAEMADLLRVPVPFIKAVLGLLRARDAAATAPR